MVQTPMYKKTIDVKSETIDAKREEKEINVEVRKSVGMKL